MLCRLLQQLWLFLRLGARLDQLMFDSNNSSPNNLSLNCLKPQTPIRGGRPSFTSAYFYETDIWV